MLGMSLGVFFGALHFQTYISTLPRPVMPVPAPITRRPVARVLNKVQLNVSMDANGAYSIANANVTLDDVMASLRVPGSRVSVTIHANDATPLESAAKLMEALEQAGVEYSLTAEEDGGTG